MTWRFAPERAPRAAVRHALDHLVERALAALADPSGPLAHEPRKALKRIRALLRLARDGIGRSERRRLDELARGAGRALAALRDAEVLPRTLDELTRGHADETVTATAIEPARRAARGELAVVRAAAAPAFVAVVARLVEARGAFRSLPSRGGWRSLLAGLRRAYRRARDAGSALDAAASTDAFHRWRKRVKDLQHQLDAFVAAGGPVATKRRGVAQLADLLGAEHDLALLADRLRGGLGELDARTRAAALVAVATRRARLRASALTLATHVFAERPRTFARVIAARWRAARTAAAPSRARPAALRSTR